MTPTSYHLNLNSNCQSTVFIFIATAAISRVMSVLYHSTNDHLSRTERCRQPQATYLKTDRASLSFPIWSCFGWGLHGYGCYQPHGSLLHHLSTLTKIEQFFYFGGIFLLHWPWSHLHRTLSGILPCEARTFLTLLENSSKPRSFTAVAVLLYNALLIFSSVYSKSIKPLVIILFLPKP